MADLKVPGVFIEEITVFPPSIAAVATAVPAFVGYTKNAVSGPKRITSFLEFEQIFGGPKDQSITITLDGSDNITGISFSDLNTLYYTIRSYYDNGGGVCYVVSAGVYGAVNATALNNAVDLLESEDEPTLIVVPEAAYLADVATAAGVYNNAISQCETLKDRFTLIDMYPAVPSGSGLSSDLTAFRTEIDGSNYGASYFPAVDTLYSYSYTPATVIFSGGTYNGQTLATATGTAPAAFIDQVNAALATFTSSVRLGSTGPVSGVYANVDANRGVWKAPANVQLRNVAGPAFRVTDADQEIMNVDATAGKSINAIRAFTGRGTIVWGARTLDSNSAEWRYINVRRLFIFIEESVQKATNTFVFEPNTAQTWTRVKGMIDNFLTGLWRQGALAGAKPSDAFFVNVGLGTTMTANDILEGIMNVEVGIAPSRPAEFIVIKFSQKLQVS